MKQLDLSDMLKIMVAVLVMCVGGCTASELAPGGSLKVTFIKATDGSTNFSLQSSKDASFTSASFDPATGLATVTGYNANGSALAGIQGNATVALNTVLSNNTTLAFNQAFADIIGLVQSGAIVIPKLAPAPAPAPAK